MTTFAMKGFNGRTIGCAMSHSELTFQGSIHVQGRQPVGDDGAPQWVADLFDENPEVMQVAIGKEKSGIVYYR